MKKKTTVNPIFLRSMEHNAEYTKSIYNNCTMFLNQRPSKSKQKSTKPSKHWPGLESLLTIEQDRRQDEMKERCDLIFHLARNFDGCTVIYFDSPEQSWSEMTMGIGNATVSIEFLASRYKIPETFNLSILGPRCYDLSQGDKIKAELYIGSVPGYIPEAYLMATDADGKEHYFELKAFHMLCDIVYPKDIEKEPQSRMFTLFDKYKHLVVIDMFSLSSSSDLGIQRPEVPDIPVDNNVPTTSDNNTVDMAEPSVSSNDIQSPVTGGDTPADDK